MAWDQSDLPGESVAVWADLSRQPEVGDRLPPLRLGSAAVGVGWGLAGSLG